MAQREMLGPVEPRTWLMGTEAFEGVVAHHGGDQGAVGDEVEGSGEVPSECLAGELGLEVGNLGGFKEPGY